VANIFLDRFVRAVPKQFLTRLLERQQALYAQSIAMSFNDQSWASAEANYILPHNRRILFESDFRKAAKEYGLSAFDSFHVGDNCAYVMVKADGLIITEHYVEGPKQFVRFAASRKQNAAVNSWVYEYTDDNLLTQPLPKLGRKPIYLNLLHGCALSQSSSGELSAIPESCFLRIAIPDDESQKYIYNWSAQEVLMAYAVTADSAAAPQAIEDKAQPRTKIKAKKRSTGNAE
jgi:hypothetical protein